MLVCRNVTLCASIFIKWNTFYRCENLPMRISDFELVLKHFTFYLNCDWQCLLNHKLLLGILWWCDTNSIGMRTVLFSFSHPSIMLLLQNSFRGKCKVAQPPTAVKQQSSGEIFCTNTRNDYYWWIYAYACAVCISILWGTSFWHSQTRLRLLMNKIWCGFEIEYWHMNSKSINRSVRSIFGVEGLLPGTWTIQICVQFPSYTVNSRKKKEINNAKS